MRPYTLALRLTLGIRCNLIPKLSKLSKIVPCVAARKMRQALSPYARPPDGGRAWSRTRDLVLIRDAL